MVIVPNENDLLKLTNLQKALCTLIKKEFHDFSFFAIPVYPLWLSSKDFSNDYSINELKMISKTITSVQLSDFSFNQTSNELYIICNAKVEFNFELSSHEKESPAENSIGILKDFSGTKIFTMPFILIKNEVSAEDKIINLTECQKKAVEEFSKKTFPLPLKIFRLGTEAKNSIYNLPNSTDLKETIWYK